MKLAEWLTEFASNWLDAILITVVVVLGVVAACTMSSTPGGVPARVFVFSEERIPIVNRETGAAEQKILLQYAIDGATYYAELDDEEELARYYEYLREVGPRAFPQW